MMLHSSQDATFISWCYMHLMMLHSSHDATFMSWCYMHLMMLRSSQMISVRIDYVTSVAALASYFFWRTSCKLRNMVAYKNDKYEAWSINIILRGFLCRLVWVYSPQRLNAFYTLIVQPEAIAVLHNLWLYFLRMLIMWKALRHLDQPARLPCVGNSAIRWNDHRRQYLLCQHSS